MFFSCRIDFDIVNICLDKKGTYILIFKTPRKRPNERE